MENQELATKICIVCGKKHDTGTPFCCVVCNRELEDRTEENFTSYNYVMKKRVALREQRMKLYEKYHVDEIGRCRICGLPFVKVHPLGTICDDDCKAEYIRSKQRSTTWHVSERKRTGASEHGFIKKPLLTMDEKVRIATLLKVSYGNLQQPYTCKVIEECMEDIATKTGIKYEKLEKWYNYTIGYWANALKEAALV